MSNGTLHYIFVGRYCNFFFQILQPKHSKRSSSARLYYKRLPGNAARDSKGTRIRLLNNEISPLIYYTCLVASGNAKLKKYTASRRRTKSDVWSAALASSAAIVWRNCAIKAESVVYGIRNISTEMWDAEYLIRLVPFSVYGSRGKGINSKNKLSAPSSCIFQRQSFKGISGFGIGILCAWGNTSAVNIEVISIVYSWRTEIIF